MGKHDSGLYLIQKERAKVLNTVYEFITEPSLVMRINKGFLYKQRYYLKLPEVYRRLISAQEQLTGKEIEIEIDILSRNKGYWLQVELL